MVPPTNPSYKGRYSEPVTTATTTTRLHSDAVKPLNAESLSTTRLGKIVSFCRVKPCLFVPATLTVENVDMSQQINKPKHYTTAYETQNLVVRRGHEFVVRVSFNRELVQEDDFQLEFLIGSNPSANKGSLVVVTFGSRRGGPWAGQILEMQGSSVLLGVTPSPTAIVGKYRTYVAISVGSGMQRTKRNAATDLYMLFNAWCPEDPVFLANDSERMEYVLNDFGIIYQGSMGSIISRSWVSNLESWTPASSSWTRPGCRSTTEATSSRWSGRDPPW
uniref:Coagulation factor XIII A chain-like n=1 Tax=Acanthochromis polyacanthus TaxID=80966 RepID=A0A3Q1GNH6_9TELE